MAVHYTTSILNAAFSFAAPFLVKSKWPTYWSFYPQAWINWCKKLFRLRIPEWDQTRLEKIQRGRAMLFAAIRLMPNRNREFLSLWCFLEAFWLGSAVLRLLMSRLNWTYNKIFISSKKIYPIGGVTWPFHMVMFFTVTANIALIVVYAIFTSGYHRRRKRKPWPTYEVVKFWYKLILRFAI